MGKWYMHRLPVVLCTSWHSLHGTGAPVSSTSTHTQIQSCDSLGSGHTMMAALSWTLQDSAGSYAHPISLGLPQTVGGNQFPAPRHFSRKTSFLSQNPSHTSTSSDHDQQFIPWKKAVPQTGVSDCIYCKYNLFKTIQKSIEELFNKFFQICLGYLWLRNEQQFRFRHTSGRAYWNFLIQRKSIPIVQQQSENVNIFFGFYIVITDSLGNRAISFLTTTKNIPDLIITASVQRLPFMGIIDEHWS